MGPPVVVPVLLTDEPYAEFCLLFHKSVSSLDKLQPDMNEQNRFRFVFEAREKMLFGYIQSHAKDCHKNVAIIGRQIFKNLLQYFI